MLGLPLAFCRRCLLLLLLLLLVQWIRPAAAVPPAAALAPPPPWSRRRLPLRLLLRLLLHCGQPRCRRCHRTGRAHRPAQHVEQRVRNEVAGAQE